MNRSPLAVLLALPLLLHAMPVWAQPPVLTLGDALRLVSKQNLPVAFARERSSAAQALSEAAGAPLLPSLSAQGNANYGAGTRISGAPALGPGLDTSVSVNYLLFDVGARSALALASHQAEAATVGLSQAEQDALAAGAIAYFQVLRAQGLARVASETYRQAQEHLRLGELRLKAGNGTRAELLQLQAMAANAQVSMIQAQNLLETNRLALGHVLNEPIGARELDASASVRPMALDQHLAAALDRRQDLRTQALKVEADRDRAALESSAQLPSLSTVGRYAWHNLEAGELYAGLNLNWTLFDGNRASNRAKAAQYDAAAAILQLEQLKKAAELEIRQTSLAREEASLRLQASANAMRAASEAYAIARRRYELGLATQVELIDVQNTWLQAENAQVMARADLSQAEIRLHRALGNDLAALAP